MKSLPVDCLIVLEVGELEEDASSGLGEAEAALEGHLLADGGGFLHGEVVGRGQQKGALCQEVF